MDGQLSFEFEQRKPIKGYPELHWTGKRPYTSTQYYPAQLKESFGEPKNGWMNKIFWGDNLQVMSHMLREFRGKVDLIYIDPPFASGADYAKKVYIRRNPKVAEAIAQAEQELDVEELKAFEEKMYGDVWDKEKYLNWMYENLMAIKSVMSETASIYVHLDYHIGHYVKILLDEIFGEDNFKNEIVWKRKQGNLGQTNRYGIVTDSIFYYTMSDNYYFETPLTKEGQDEYIKRFKYDDGDGRIYRRRHRGVDEKGEAIWEKQYLDESKGVPLTSVWSDIKQIYANPQAYKNIRIHLFFAVQPNF